MVKVTGLQYPMVFAVELTDEDIGDEIQIEVPPGFVLLSVALAKRAAFNGTEPQVSIVDNKTVPTVLLQATDLSTLDVPNVEGDLASRYAEYRSGGKIRILPVVTGEASTTGRADVLVSGVVRGRQNERFGSRDDA